MKKLFLPIIVSLIFCNTGFTRSTGCTEGDCNNGYGTWTYTDLTTYVGEWRDGKKHGQGTVNWPNGYLYCLLYTSPSPRDAHESRMPSSA